MKFLSACLLAAFYLGLVLVGAGWALGWDRTYLLDMLQGSAPLGLAHITINLLIQNDALQDRVAKLEGQE